MRIFPWRVLTSFERYGSLNVVLRDVLESPAPPSAPAAALVRQVLTVMCFAPFLLSPPPPLPPDADGAAGAGSDGARFWRAATELAVWNGAATGPYSVSSLAARPIVWHAFRRDKRLNACALLQAS